MLVPFIVKSPKKDVGQILSDFFSQVELSGEIQGRWKSTDVSLGWAGKEGNGKISFMAVPEELRQSFNQYLRIAGIKASCLLWSCKTYGVHAVRDFNISCKASVPEESSIDYLEVLGIWVPNQEIWKKQDLEAFEDFVLGNDLLKTNLVSLH